MSLLAVGLAAAVVRLIIAFVGIQNGIEEGYGAILAASVAAALLALTLFVMLVLWWLRATTLGGATSLRERYPAGVVLVVACPDDPEDQLAKIATSRGASAPSNFKLLAQRGRIELWKGSRPKVVASLASNDIIVAAITHTRLLSPQPALLVEGSTAERRLSLIVYPLREDGQWVPRLMDAPGVERAASELNAVISGVVAPRD